LKIQVAGNKKTFHPYYSRASLEDQSRWFNS